MFITKTKFTSVLILCATLSVAACGGGGGGGKNAAPGSDPGQSQWLLPRNFVADGGPGRDGIPALTSPSFEPVSSNEVVRVLDLAIAVLHEGSVKIYPHDIMNWHEIVNDGPADNPYTLSYCPLTGSAMAWHGIASHADSSFGVSGLLYNSNLLLFDRQTNSLWSQMYQESVNGSRINELPERLQVIEAAYGTLLRMFPDAMLMTRATGHIRDYPVYPYGEYRTNGGLLFDISNRDNRIHPKTRVVGVRVSEGVDGITDNVLSKVYQLVGFGSTMQTINDQVGNLSIVVVGNTLLNFALIYNREMPDGTILNFSPIEDDLPNVMSDDEGNVWNVFGAAVSGPRTGEQLEPTNSYVAYWFAWAAHFPGADIHFN
jgi:hypothetical protein